MAGHRNCLRRPRSLTPARRHVPCTRWRPGARHCPCMPGSGNPCRSTCCGQGLQSRALALRPHPDFVHSRCRLVILAIELGGRWLSDYCMAAAELCSACGSLYVQWWSALLSSKIFSRQPSLLSADGPPTRALHWERRTVLKSVRAKKSGGLSAIRQWPPANPTPPPRGWRERPRERASKRRTGPPPHSTDRRIRLPVSAGTRGRHASWPDARLGLLTGCGVRRRTTTPV